ncbi:phosphotransferase [Stenotrophomonas sp.]|uniref:phosphotransferase enzyme family protein n=1 Tax=Stenotrophomonas sp. TaxID=69392 RepID=UPI002897B13A|nr:phosphotransferase [Stenotrophomonas sp.]
MNTPQHRVQGLDNDQVQADWPAIDAPELAWLGSRHPALAGTCTVLWHSPRPFSAAALVQTPGGRVFVKRHHLRVRTAAALEEEHRFIAHLADAAVPVVQVLPAADGHTALTHGDWTYEVHAEGVGTDLYREVPSWTPLTELAHARQVGAMLAHLHRAAADYRAPQRSTHVLVARDDLIRSADPVAQLHVQLAERPGLAAYLASVPWERDITRAIGPWHAALGGRYASEPVRWAHNDWHVSNLLWQGRGAEATISTVFDFGLAAPTSALFDLATAIERNAVDWLASGGPVAHADTALALLEGYRQQRPLTAADVTLLADLLPVVHLDFALSEVEYFHAVTGSRANADVAYHTFLIGHATWSASPAGRVLLDRIRSAV